MNKDNQMEDEEDIYDAVKHYRADHPERNRKYTLTEQECYPTMAEPMFPVDKLREAFDYYTSKRKGKLCYYDDLFNWLCRLEKDIPLKDQRYQP